MTLLRYWMCTSLRQLLSPLITVFAFLFSMNNCWFAHANEKMVLLHTERRRFYYTMREEGSTTQWAKKVLLHNERRRLYYTMREEGSTTQWEKRALLHNERRRLYNSIREEPSTTHSERNLPISSASSYCCELHYAFKIHSVRCFIMYISLVRFSFAAMFSFMETYFNWLFVP